MPLYPLGISRSCDVPSVPTQAAGAVRMRWRLAGELACAYIDAPHDAIRPMLYATALDAIHRRICVLPVRFGMAVHDEIEIGALLEGRSDELLDRLRRLDRTCEMGLRVTPPTIADPGQPTPAHTEPCLTVDAPVARGPCPSSPPQSAACAVPPAPLAYIEARRAHYRQTDGNVERDRLLVEQFVERLHGYYRQWRKLQSSPTHPIRMAFLVGRDRVAAFRSRVEDTCGLAQEGRYAILGPWPPYSFV